MAKKAAKHAHLPDEILGLKCSQHRIDYMKQILTYYYGRVRPNGTKPYFLRQLLDLEKRLSRSEVRFIMVWLEDPPTYGPFSRARSRVQLQPERSRVELSEDEDEEEEDSILGVSGVQQEADDHMECSVCMESLLSIGFPLQKLTSACDHKMTVCNGCMCSLWIQNLLYPHDAVAYGQDVCSV